MPDEQSLLPAEVVRKEASLSLSAIHSGQGGRLLVESHWQELWQLVREAKAAGTAIGGSAGPWHIRDGDGLNPLLVAGSFGVPLWPAGELRTASDLPALLNWAQVPSPAAH
jgi:hypothetical protein